MDGVFEQKLNFGSTLDLSCNRGLIFSSSGSDGMLVSQHPSPSYSTDLESFMNERNANTEKGISSWNIDSDILLKNENSAATGFEMEGTEVYDDLSAYLRHALSVYPGVGDIFGSLFDSESVDSMMDVGLQHKYLR